MPSDNVDFASLTWKLPPLETVLADLRARGIELPAGNICVGAFGDSAELSEQLLALIRAGKKRGGASLLWSYQAENEALPVAGDIEIVLNHHNVPVLISRVTKVEAFPFNEVTAEFAAVEGEGDSSLDYWRREHWQCFVRDCARMGRTPTETMTVICESFEVLQILAA